MSFREKSAWITLGTVVVCFGGYFAAILTGLTPRYDERTLQLAIAALAALVVLQIILHIAAAMLDPVDARAPRDERERMIQARSHTAGYYVLQISAIGLILPTHMAGFNRIDFAHFALGGVVAATIAVSVSQIIQFRRGG